MGYNANLDKYLNKNGAVSSNGESKTSSSSKTTSTPKTIDVNGVKLRDTGNVTTVKTNKGTVRVRATLGEKIAYGVVATAATLTLVGTGFGAANVIASLANPQYGIFEALSWGIQTGLNFVICKKTLGTALKNSPIPGIKKMYDKGAELKEKFEDGTLFYEGKKSK